AVLVGLPLADVSMSMAFHPETRFPGWQWVLLGLALPVAAWCAWPFHRAAAVTARHGGTSMDTLVSTGIVAATTGWSVYAMFAGPAAAGGSDDDGPVQRLVELHESRPLLEKLDELRGAADRPVLLDVGHLDDL
ncbi:MAG: P-type Cu+ transporter, partial [Pseudonocardiales bacterium]|nr:P-type Cu+ transporter [Pseudonocardiales bacterium]